MNNPIYVFTINNCRRYLKNVNAGDSDTINAFVISEVLSIAFCKSKESIFSDLVFDNI